MDIVENRSYKTKVLWDFSPSTFIYAQGHVRKLAALLHVPRAASSGEGRSPTRYIINGPLYLHPILNLGIVVIILIFFDKKRNFSQEFCTDIRFFYGAKKVHKKMAAVYKNSAAGLLGVHNLSTEKNR